MDSDYIRPVFFSIRVLMKKERINFVKVASSFIVNSGNKKTKIESKKMLISI